MKAVIHNKSACFCGCGAVWGGAWCLGQLPRDRSLYLGLGAAKRFSVSSCPSSSSSLLLLLLLSCPDRQTDSGGCSGVIRHGKPICSSRATLPTPTRTHPPTHPYDITKVKQWHPTKTGAEPCGSLQKPGNMPRLCEGGGVLGGCTPGRLLDERGRNPENKGWGPLDR